MKKIFLLVMTLAMLFTFTACKKECANGCGKEADPECMAEMCDSCCDYWMGLNGCTKTHYDSKWY